MLGFDEIDVQIVRGEHGAAHGRHGDRRWSQAQLAKDFGDQPMDDPVAAARAVVRGAVLEQAGAGVVTTRA